MPQLIAAKEKTWNVTPADFKSIQPIERNYVKIFVIFNSGSKVENVQDRRDLTRKKCLSKVD